ncbi:hypothetical protein SVIOM74S_09680 [Streptomyces violarus]
MPYAAASTVGDGLADAEAAAFAALSVLSPEPESEEQPAATSIGDGGRADKDAVESLRSLVSLFTLCSSLHGSFTHDARGSCGRNGSEWSRYAVRPLCVLPSAALRVRVKGA